MEDIADVKYTQFIEKVAATKLVWGLKSKTGWANILSGDAVAEDNVANDQLLIESHRIDSVPGTHTVIYDSEVDTIEFKHTAHNRNGFALGAVLAAEWIQDKKGFYTVSDMFNFDI